jgi:drug/metabolite transporter (DMT)-like permease
MSPNLASLVAVLAAFAWGCGNVAQKTILLHIDAWSATGLTSLIGALVLIPLTLREGRGPLPPAKGTRAQLLVISLLFTLAITLMQFAYGLTTVTNAGFLVNTAAVLTPILAWLVFRQRPAAMIWPASLLALVGIFLMAGAKWSGLSPGDVLALASAAAFAFWTLAVGAYVIRTRRPVLMTTVQLAASGVICTALGAVIVGLPDRAALALALPELLFLGLVSKGLAYVLIAIAQQHISATSAGVLVSAEAVFGASVAALILGESLGVLRGLGSLCIILGVIVAARIPQLPGENRILTRHAQP